jgi:hypothetical protein
LHNILAEGKLCIRKNLSPPAEVQNLKVGDTVRIKGSNSTGIIEEFLRNGEMHILDFRNNPSESESLRTELTAPKRKNRLSVNTVS